MKVWKLVSGIISLVIVLIILFQSCAVGVANTMSKSDDMSGTLGVLVAMLLIAAGIVSIVVKNSQNKKSYIPLIILYGLGALIGFTSSGKYADLVVWAVWCLVCAIVAAVGLVKQESEQEGTNKPLYKQWWFWLSIGAAVIFVFIVIANVSNNKNFSKNNSSEDIETTEKLETVPDSEIDYVYSNPEKYAGKRVIIKGRVSDSVEKTKDGVSFTVYADPHSIKKSATIYAGDLDVDIKDEDYVVIDGVVLSDEDVEDFNMSDVNIDATKVKKSNYIDVCSPTLKTYKINKTINQRGYKVTLKKVELAKNETRAYIKVKNSGKAEFDLYEHSAKLIQGHKQYETDNNFDADYPELPDSMEKGIKAKTILSFKKIKVNKSFTLKIPASSDDYEENITDYVFNVNIK